MITLKHLKENYPHQTYNQYEVIDDCEEHLVVVPYTEDSYHYFSEGINGYSRYFNCYFTVITVLKREKEKYVYFLGNSRIPTNDNKFIILCDFKFLYPQIWKKISDYYFGDEEKQLGILKYDPKLIEFFEDPSEAAQLEAVSNYSRAIEYIERPYHSVIELHRSLYEDASL